jgi:hypothetical protein
MVDIRFMGVDFVEGENVGSGVEFGKAPFW